MLDAGCEKPEVLVVPGGEPQDGNADDRPVPQGRPRDRIVAGGVAKNPFCQVALSGLAGIGSFNQEARDSVGSEESSESRDGGLLEGYEVEAVIPETGYRPPPILSLMM